RPQTLSLFPYTTLFRSVRHDGGAHRGNFFCITAPAAGRPRTRRQHGFSYPQWLAPAGFSLSRNQRIAPHKLNIPTVNKGVLLARSEEHTSELQSRENLV